MTRPVYPLVIPSEHPTLVLGEFPHVEQRSTSGRRRRIGLSNALVNGIVTLTYKNIDTASMLALWSHWQAVRGIARDFQIPSELFPRLHRTTRDRLIATLWRMTGAPTVTDACGGQQNFLLHSLEITLRAQPRRILSPIDSENPGLSTPTIPVVAPGGQMFATAGIIGGAAGINEARVPGGQFAARAFVVGGSAVITPTVAPITGQMSAIAEVTGGGVTTPSGQMSAVAEVTGGAARIEGVAPGGQMSATAAATGGAAAAPPRVAPGGQMSATATMIGGSGTIQGPAPGGQMSATAVTDGGRAQAIGPGGQFAATAAMVGGAAQGIAPGGQMSATASMVGGAVLSATYQNTSTITIPAYGNASPYPSTIVVAGAGSNLSSIRLTLRTVTAPRIQEIHILLVGPTGEVSNVMAYNGSGGVAGFSLVFSNSATVSAPTIASSWQQGVVYIPGNQTNGPVYSSPAPGPPTGTTGYPKDLSRFVGLNPNGAWSLFCTDSTSNAITTPATILGWELQLTTS